MDTVTGVFFAKGLGKSGGMLIPTASPRIKRLISANCRPEQSHPMSSAEFLGVLQPIAGDNLFNGRNKTKLVIFNHGYLRKPTTA
jgi:hypothetical protein